MRIEARLEELGLVLPEPPRLPFSLVRLHGDRAVVSGHGPQLPDGSPAPPFGKVGAEVSVEEAYQAARLTALSMLGSLQRALGDLDRITAWLRIFGMVNAAPGFTNTPTVINGCSDLILDLSAQKSASTLAPPSAWRNSRSTSRSNSRQKSPSARSPH